MNNKIQNQLNILTKILNQESFLSNKGLGKEIPFYIFDYDPKYEFIIRDYLKNINTKIRNDTKVKIIDLYDVILGILKERNYLEKVFEMEQKEGSESIEKALRPILKPENLVNKIKTLTLNSDIIILCGIGKAFPLVRSHTVLNNLHTVFNNLPVIIFFPGEYNKTELKLFGKLKDDNYYRAFKLTE